MLDPTAGIQRAHGVEKLIRADEVARVASIENGSGHAEIMMDRGDGFEEARDEQSNAFNNSGNLSRTNT
jgi:hypothetical protein